MTIPVNQPDHHYHLGVVFLNKPLASYLKEPGEEPCWVEMGHLCPICGFTESPAAIRMRLEAEMGWAT